MRRTLRTVLIGVSLVVAAVGCGRSSSHASLGNMFAPATPKPASWSLAGCDDLCELVDTHAATLDALCSAVVQKVDKLGAATCKATSLDYKSVPASAISGAAMLDVQESSGGSHHAFLTVKTAAGYRVARSLGKADKIGAFSARPVDLPGLAPAGVELRVALDSAERLYVCGVDGAGKTACPVAIQTAGAPPTAAIQPMGAGIAGAIKGGAWRARVELGPQGYVAHAEQGDLPAGLAGDHPYLAE